MLLGGGLGWGVGERMVTQGELILTPTNADLHPGNLGPPQPCIVSVWVHPR
jgi:hypothetical protein